MILLIVCRIRPKVFYNIIFTFISTNWFTNYKYDFVKILLLINFTKESISIGYYRSIMEKYI
jgi:hypothetical protein